MKKLGDAGRPISSNFPEAHCPASKCSRARVVLAVFLFKMRIIQSMAAIEPVGSSDVKPLL
jgi:hypothetical protein